MILFGSLFSLFSDRESRQSVFNESYFWHGLVFASIFNVAVLYAILYYPDWMWMYFLEDSHNSASELIYIFIFLYYLPYVFGYYLGRDLKRRSWVFWTINIVFMIGAEVWIVLHLFDRYSVIGTREEFLQGKAISLFGPDNPIGLVMNGSIGVMVLYFFIVVYLFKRKIE